MSVPASRLTAGAFVLLAAAASGCATSGPAGPWVAPPRLSPVVAPDESAVVRTALRYLGTPYVLGGVTPDGFDCSGFVWYVYRAHGVMLPRNVAKQAAVGRHVGRGDIQAGDLVFFSTTAPGVTHVGLATSRDAFVHAPNSRGVVRIEMLTSAYWSAHFAGARRVAP